MGLGYKQIYTVINSIILEGYKCINSAFKNVY